MKKLKPEVLNHIGISGGKDSTALLLWALYESGYPRKSIVVSACDTGNENEFTYRYIFWLAHRLGVRVHWIVPPLGFYDLARKKKRFPSARARFCTEHLKILPTQKYISGLLDQGFDVVLHTGVRAAESAQRATYKPEEFSELYDCYMRMPLLSFTLADVWAMHEKYDVPPNPLYGLTETLPWNGQPNPFYGDGVMRVGCDPCIMSRKSEIEAMARNRPERIAFLAAQEHTVKNRHGYSSFFSRDKVPLSQRSKEILAKSGEVMLVATADDVARWSQTSRGGQQYKMHLPMMQEIEDESPACQSRYGACE